MGVDDEVLAGTSGSLLDHPSEFIESRNADEVILTGHSHLLSLMTRDAVDVTPSRSRFCPGMGSLGLLVRQKTKPSSFQGFAEVVILPSLERQKTGGLWRIYWNGSLSSLAQGLVSLVTSDQHQLQAWLRK